jgi:hypothetical protein
MADSKVEKENFLEHLTGIIAATVALFLVAGVAYWLVFSSVFNVNLQALTTFADFINISIRRAPTTVSLVAANLMFVVLLLNHFRKSSTTTIMRRNLYLLFYISVGLFSGPLVLFLQDQEIQMPAKLSPVIISTSLVIMFGIAISWIIAASLLRNRYSLIPLIISPTVLLSMISVNAAVSSMRVLECDEPLTLTYTSETKQRPRQQVCVLLTLERGMILYDRKAAATIFTPWSQVLELTRLDSWRELPPLEQPLQSDAEPALGQAGREPVAYIRQRSAEAPHNAGPLGSFLTREI